MWVTGIMVFLGGTWALVQSGRLWHDPSRLRPGTLMYRAVFGRLHGRPPRQNDIPLSASVISAYATGMMVGSLLVTVGGLALVVADMFY